jgi:hypothetical protein
VTSTLITKSPAPLAVMYIQPHFCVDPRLRRWRSQKDPEQLASSKVAWLHLIFCSWKQK